MYSVALDNTVALFNLWAGASPSRSSSSSSSSPFPERVITRRLGTLSRRAAILSLRLVRYLFSIMLCAVFLIGCFDDGLSLASSSTDDLRFFLLSTADVGSGDEGTDEGELGWIRVESGLCLWLEVERVNDETFALLSNESGDTSAALL